MAEEYRRHPVLFLDAPTHHDRLYTCGMESVHLENGSLTKETRLKPR